MKKAFLILTVFLMTVLLANCFVLQLSPVFCQTPGGTQASDPSVLDKNMSIPFLDQATNFLSTLYTYLRDSISNILEKTLFKEDPNLALFYGDAVTLLTSLTAVYLILLMVTIAKKIVGVVLALGWALLIVSVVIRSVV